MTMRKMTIVIFEQTDDIYLFSLIGYNSLSIYKTSVWEVSDYHKLYVIIYASSSVYSLSILINLHVICMYIHPIHVSIYLIHSFPYLFINHHSYIPFFRLKEDDEVDDSNSVVFSVSGRSVHHLVVTV